MKTLLIILISILSFSSYSQITTHKQLELRKARCMIAATVIPAFLSAAGAMTVVITQPKDKAIIAIPLVNMTFFFGASVKAINEKNKIKRQVKY